ncbi:MAG: type II toxin-antitoxin system RelE/ParE family toxin [Lachnospiraceae bacterium]|nr:type II toxin-antitoxin system RelE/ParE family toxin [Lachnospiraceae bacterium]
MRYISYNGSKKGVCMFQIEFYETKDGQRPIEEFLDSLDDKMTAKLVGLMEILEEYGNNLRMPYSKHLEDGIFELRCKQGSGIVRILYFFYYEGKIIITNGFVKKTQKTPRQEIETAKQRRDDWISREGR